MELDSAEGIKILVDWAIARKIVLNEFHEKIAKKYNVDTTGLIVSRPLPKV